ncbi:MAG: hypothetical protein JJD96_07475 [Thermoleophilia bacterium]|nr:hypothetical protein [Thermoleophilia bacterium]
MFVDRNLEEPGVPEECFERTGMMTKTTMIIDGEVVSGFANNFDRVKELVQKHQALD